MSTDNKSRRYEAQVEAFGSFNDLKDQFMRKSEYLQRLYGKQFDQSSTNPILYFSEDPEMVKLITSKKEKLQNIEKQEKMQRTGSFTNKKYAKKDIEDTYEEIQGKIQLQKRKLAILQRFQIEKSLSRQHIKNQIKNNQKYEKIKTSSKDPFPLMSNKRMILGDSIQSKKKGNRQKIVQQGSEYENQQQLYKQALKNQEQSRMKLKQPESKRLSLIKNINSEIMIKPQNFKPSSSNAISENKSETGSKQRQRNIGISSNINLKLEPNKIVREQQNPMQSLFKGRFKNIKKIQIDNSQIEAHNSPTAVGRNAYQIKNTFSSTAGQFYNKVEKNQRNDKIQQYVKTGNFREKIYYQDGQKLSSSEGFKYTPSKNLKQIFREKEANEYNNRGQRNEEEHDLMQSGSIGTFGYRRAIDYEHRSLKNMMKIEQKSIQQSGEIIQSILDRDDEQMTIPIGTSLNQNNVVKEAKIHLSTYNSARKTMDFKKQAQKIQTKYSRFSQNQRYLRESPNLQNMENIQQFQKKKRPAKQDYIWNKTKLVYDKNNRVEIVTKDNHNNNNIQNVSTRVCDNNTNQRQNSEKYQKYINKSYISQFLKESKVQNMNGMKQLLRNYEFDYKIQPPVRLEGNLNYSLSNKQQQQRFTPIKPDYSSKDLISGTPPSHLKSSEKNDIQKLKQKKQKIKQLSNKTTHQIQNNIKKKEKQSIKISRSKSNKLPLSQEIQKSSKQLMRKEKVKQKSEQKQIQKGGQMIQNSQKFKLQKPSSTLLPSLSKTGQISLKDNSGNKTQTINSISQKLRLKPIQKLPEKMVKLDNFEFPKLPGYPHSYLIQPEINQIIIKTYALFKITVTDMNLLTISQMKNYVYAVYDDIHIAWYPNSHFYIGGWKKNKTDGNPHGLGIDFFPEKYLYEGAFVQGKREGFGKLKVIGGEYYQGQFQKGLKHGFGKCEELSGRIYEGEWKNDKKEGFGKIINGQKQIYTGNFTNDMKHGKGEEIFNNGDSYKGEYDNGRFSGSGIYIWQNGAYYQGEFKAGWRNGKGLWRSSKLNAYDTYEGQYINDKKSGRGKYIWANGAYFQGEFLNDLRHGKGIIKLVSQETVEGIWEKGVAKGAVRMLEDDFYRQSQKQCEIINGSKDIPIEGIGADNVAGVVLKGRSSSSSSWKVPHKSLIKK